MWARPARPLALCAALVVAGAVWARAAAGPLDCSRLVEAAAARGLAEDPYWRTLLHVRRGWFHERSLMDDPSFFLAEDGALDPWAEMEAELRALCQPPTPEPGQAPWCRFPARYAWLADRLGFDPARISPEGCPDLAEALDRLDPGGASLVFPAAHGGSPASMFGHTLVRIDPAGRSPLLAHAVNFAARTDPDDPAVVYALKGLTGLYPGYYTLQPYYEKVLQYADSEQRDVWIYRLNLTPDEARRLALHAWELKDRYARYYYLDENCSYQILFLLEAARPGVRLTDRYPAWVTPLDTVEDVLAEGLVERVEYEPSMVRRLNALARSLERRDVARVQALAGGRAAPAELRGPAARRAVVLDAAAARLRIGFVRGDLDSEVYRARYLGLLAARSRIGTAPQDPPIPRPPAPHEGHASARVRAGAGGPAGRPGMLLGLRPSYHGLEDPVAGYEPGSEIAFLDTELRVGTDRGGPVLDRFDLVRIVSLNPWSAFFRPWSWSVRLGIGRRPGRGRDGTLTGVGAFGAGLTLAPAKGWLVYGLAVAEVWRSRRGADRTGLGAGGEAGFLWQPWKRLSAGVRGRWTGHVLGPDRPFWQGVTWFTWGLSRNLAFQVRAGREGGYPGDRTRWEAACLWFF